MRNLLWVLLPLLLAVNADAQQRIDLAKQIETGAEGDIIVLTNVGEQSYLNIGAAGTILTSDGTTAAWQAPFSFLVTDGTTPQTVDATNNTITFNDGANLDFTTSATGNVNIAWAVGPTTGGSTQQVLQFDDTGDTYSWVTIPVGESTTVTDGNSVDFTLTGYDITGEVIVNEQVNGIDLAVGVGGVSAALDLEELTETTTFDPAVDFIGVSDGGVTSKAKIMAILASAKKTHAFISHSSAILTIGGTLPTANPHLIKVYVNGVLQYDNVNGAGFGNYTVDSGTQITLDWTPTSDHILVEWYE